MNIIRYIYNRKWNVVITDDHDCSFEGARYYRKYTGIITDYNVTSYEDAQIKLQIKINDNIQEIWLSDDYYVYNFNMKDIITYIRDNGDGTCSWFIIEMKDKLDDNNRFI